MKWLQCTITAYFPDDSYKMRTEALIFLDAVFYCFAADNFHFSAISGFINAYRPFNYCCLFALIALICIYVCVFRKQTWIQVGPVTFLAIRLYIVKTKAFGEAESAAVEGNSVMRSNEWQGHIHL